MRASALRLFLLITLVATLVAGQTKRRGSVSAAADAAAPSSETPEPTESDVSDADGVDTSGAFERRLALYSREEKIDYWQGELDHVRRDEVGPALDELARRQAAVNAIRGGSGWFPTAAEKARLSAAEAALRAAQMQLDRAQSREVAVVRQLKPLWGLVSYEFVHEQRSSISGSLKKVNELSYNQAWWSSMFDLGRRESFTDVIVGFFFQWFVSYVLMYPFAVLYYALWVLPWSIWEYSSSATDVVTGAVLFVGWVGVMLLPIAALVVGATYIGRHYGPYLARMAEENQRRRQAEQQRRAAMYARVGGMGGPMGGRPPPY